MATKTLILRPTGSNFGATTFYPEGDSTTAYLLVSEELADEDSTYVLTESTLPRGGFTFTLPDIPTVPIAIRIIVRACTSINDSTMTLSYPTAGLNEDVQMGYSDKISLSTTYEDYSYSIPNEDIPLFWYAINNRDCTSGHVTTSCGANSTDSKASKNAKITQLYLEIDYEDEKETCIENIYLKKNSAWLELSCEIYQKQEGIWLKTNSTVFKNNSKFKFQE